MGIFVVLAIACFFLQAEGAPSTQRTPCWDRQEQVQLDIASVARIVNEPRYVPECESDGVTWKQAQCSHEDIGYCFCVDPTTGTPREETRSYLTNKESLNCDASERPSIEFTPCQQQQRAYKLFIEQWPAVVDIPFEYYPSCENTTSPSHSFMAMQRNALSFFCVDTTTGDVIPRTDFFGNENRKPLHEDVCQSYSHIWQEYASLIGILNPLLEEMEESSDQDLWYVFLNENANNVIRSFWQSEATSVEINTGEVDVEGTNVNETFVEISSIEQPIPEEVEHVEIEPEQEEFEQESTSSPEATTAPEEEEEESVNPLESEYTGYEYYPYEPFNFIDQYHENENSLPEEPVNTRPEQTEETSNNTDNNNQEHLPTFPEIPEEGTNQQIDLEELRNLFQESTEHLNVEELLRLLNAEEPSTEEQQNEVTTERNTSQNNFSGHTNRYLSGDSIEDGPQSNTGTESLSAGTARLEENLGNVVLRKSST